MSIDNCVWKSRLFLSTKLKLYNVCILPIMLYGSECWALSRVDARKVDALDHYCIFSVNCVIYVCLQYFNTVGWVLRPVKNRRPYNLYCVGGDVKPCSINQSISQKG